MPHSHHELGDRLEASESVSAKDINDVRDAAEEAVEHLYPVEDLPARAHQLSHTPQADDTEEHTGELRGRLTSVEEEPHRSFTEGANQQHKKQDDDFSHRPQNGAPALSSAEEQYPTHHQKTENLVKPRNYPGKTVSRWEPADYELSEASEDEFELSTCLHPVFEDDDGVPADIQFKNGCPDYRGDILSCFEEPNLLYRIINREEKKWAFYNDSLHYEMHITFTFGKHSKIQPLDNTTMHVTSKGEVVMQVVVHPTETEMFIKGHVNGFTSKLRALPLSEEYHKTRRALADDLIQQEVRAIQEVAGVMDSAEEVLQVCIENNLPFVDPEFPPCQESLEYGGKKQFKPLAWARPSVFLPEELKDCARLFRTQIKPGVIDAGDLGDSWVMCAIATITEDPTRLRAMFRHPEGKEAGQKERAVGAYRVTFNKSGWWRSVLVDSYLPISSGRPKFAKSATDMAELWPCILQKAFAKLHGSYANICSGDPLHALQDMTGFSTTRFDDAFANAAASGDDSLLRDWSRYIAAGYTIICSTPGKESHSAADSKGSKLTQQYKDVGLVTGHAYTILDVKSFPDTDLRLVKVRNAWGRGLEWNGDWSDKDIKWKQYPEVAGACHFQDAADGTFWMPWEECLKWFNGGGVCFTRPRSWDYRVNCSFVGSVPTAVLEVEVKSPTWFSFVISQEDKRTRSDAVEYQPVMISVTEPADNDMYKVVMNSSVDGAHPSYDKWTFLQARDVTLINKFEPGRYIIIPRLMSMDNQPDMVPYVLTIISNKELGTGDATVGFKCLSNDNRVFENFPKYEPELFPVESVQYQKRAPGTGFPDTQFGQAAL